MLIYKTLIKQNHVNLLKLELKLEYIALKSQKTPHRIANYLKSPSGEVLEQGKGGNLILTFRKKDRIFTLASI